MITDYLTDIKFKNDGYKIYDLLDDGFGIPDIFAYCGEPGCGKTTAYCTQLENQIRHGRLYKLYLFSKSYEANRAQFFDKMDIKLLEVVTDVDNEEVINQKLGEMIKEREDEMKKFYDIREKYPTFEEYLEFKKNEEEDEEIAKSFEEIGANMTRAQRFQIRFIQPQVETLKEEKKPKEFTEEEIEQMRDEYKYPRIATCVLDDVQSSILLKNGRSLFSDVLTRFRHLGLVIHVGFHMLNGNIMQSLMSFTRVWVIFASKAPYNLKPIYNKIFKGYCSEATFIKYFPKIVDGKNVKFMVLNKYPIKGDNQFSSKVELRLNWNVIYEDAVAEFKKIEDIEIQEKKGGQSRKRKADLISIKTDIV